jgi:HAD superfamily hydrolase (TIGR01509 family)
MIVSMNLLIFDCDGTLVDSELVAVNVFTTYWATHGVHITADEFKENFIGTAREAEINVKTFAKMPPDAWDEGNRLLDVALEKELEAVKGIRLLLESLTTQSCVASNSSFKYIKRALKQTQLNHFFGERVFSAEFVDRPKPHPDLFLYVAKTLGVTPEECVVIEDSQTGILAAQRANMRVIGFSGAAHFVPTLESKLRALNPSWFCSNIRELGQVLRDLEFSAS